MAILSQINEEMEDVGKATLKKILGHMSHSGVSVDPKKLMKGNIDKWLKELDGKDASTFVEKTDKNVHKLMLALYAKKNGVRDSKGMADVIGMAPEEMLNLAHNNVEELTKLWPGFKPSFFPEPKSKFVQRFPAGDRKAVIKKHMEELANSEHGSEAAIDVAKTLIKKYNLNDDEQSLRRAIDKSLESMPELDRYRPKKT